uniref:CUB domain-containing protein n=1 Tax=Panagrolaimus sp. ES5 TaxID=591445 RepID=A0AC34F0X5_9BILA
MTFDIGNTVFKNGNYDTGYPPYQQCNNPIIIPENFEGILTLDESYYEKCCDKLVLAYDGQERVLDYNSITLTSAANGSQIVFTSDGNTQAAGYKVTLQTYGNSFNIVPNLTS